MEEAMSRGLGSVERLVIEVVERSEHGLTPLRVAQLVHSDADEVTVSDQHSIRRALDRLTEKGFILRGLGGRYYALRHGGEFTSLSAHRARRQVPSRS
jgi:hypothetical protein